jgi:hypothetical protein
MAASPESEANEVERRVGRHFYRRERMKTIAKYSIFMLIGPLLAVNGWHAWDSWQFWVWFISLMVAVYARDWALTSNVELTGAARLYRAASSDRRERG